MKNQFQISALTDVGMARDHNEDNFIVCPDLAGVAWHLTEGPVTLSSSGCLLVVADGMGGTNAGEVASEIAVEFIREYFRSLTLLKEVTVKQAKDYLIEAILGANQAIVHQGKQNPVYAGMGTTIILAWILPGQAVLAWSGDSRGYHFTEAGGLKVATRDHSLVWELVEAGKLTAEEADQHPDNNIITQSLGDEQHPPKPEAIVLALGPADKLLLCSDGLNNMLDHAALAEILVKKEPVAALTRELIDKANSKGGKDNITAVLVEFLGSGTEVPEKKSNHYRTVLIAMLFLLLLVAFWGISRTKNKDKALTTAAAVSEGSEALGPVMGTVEKTPQSHSMHSDSLSSIAYTGETNSSQEQAVPVAADKTITEISVDPPAPAAAPDQKASAGGTESPGPLTSDKVAALEKAISIVDAWEALESRITAERSSKNTKHNTDSTDVDGWLLLDQKQRQVKDILDKYDLLLLVHEFRKNSLPDSLAQRLTKFSPESLNSDLLKAEQILESNKASL